MHVQTHMQLGKLDHVLNSLTQHALRLHRTVLLYLQKEGCCSMQQLFPAHLIGMFSPRTGAPSMISYFAIVSLSLCALLPAPAHRTAA
jgi:hypothetical protein